LGSARTSRLRIQNNQKNQVLTRPRFEGLDDRVDEERVVEFRFVAGDFALYWQKARGERLFPFDRESGDVAENQVELFDGDVAGKRNGVEARAANGGV